MSAFTNFLASHPSLANTVLGGETLTYTPHGGAGFPIVGIIRIGDVLVGHAEVMV